VRSYRVYDHAGRPFFSHADDGSWSKVTFSTDTELCPTGTTFVQHQSSADGTEEQICKDMLGRETRTLQRGFSGQWITNETRYDYASRPIQVSEPYTDTSSPRQGTVSYCENTPDSTCLAQPYWTTKRYDDVGRLIELKMPNGAVHTNAYDGFHTMTTDSKGREMTSIKNAMGETVAEQNHQDNAMTIFVYDALGQLTETHGPLGGDSESSVEDSIYIKYDVHGHRKRVDDPDMGVWKYRHNALGELVCQKDARGSGVHMEYDDLGRLIRRTDLVEVDIDDCDQEGGSETQWQFHNVSEEPEFGQVVWESTSHEADEAGVESEIKREFGYDDLGRLEETLTTVREDGLDGGSWNNVSVYEERVRYDHIGRVFQKFDASGDDRGQRMVYNEYGFLISIREAQHGQHGTAYWTVNAMDARGNVIEAEMGNGMQVYADHAPATGELLMRSDLHYLSGQFGQFKEYEWDQIGRLVRRDDLSNWLNFEHFEYDDRDRLQAVWHSISAGASSTPQNNPIDWEGTQSLRYDESGNIICKSDVAGIDCLDNNYVNYIYDETNGAGPHAVARVHTSSDTREFVYDENGNVEEEKINGDIQREFHYTSYNLLRRVTTKQGPGMPNHSEFHYGSERMRVIRRDMEGDSLVERTHYIGGIEIVYDGASEHAGTVRRYVAGVALVKLKSGSITRIRYQHKDHLGSLTALSDEFGNVIARMGFDAWGKRRNQNSDQPHWVQWTDLKPSWAVPMLAQTPRGYTGHEHLDDHGIIHMNGRIYDPHLGRFLQADPFVEDTATLNRYTYVHNNPLLYYDPSGYLSFKDIVKIAAVVVVTYFTAGLVHTAGTWGAAVGWGAVGGAVSGAIMTGSIEGTLWGAFGGAVFAGIGHWSKDWGSWARKAEGSTRFSGPGLAAASVTHGIAGGTLSRLQGGRFGHGFLSAGVTKAMSPSIQYGLEGYPAAQITAAAVVGGTVSDATGGKFANGAVTAAMAYAFKVPDRGSVNPSPLGDG